MGTTENLKAGDWVRVLHTDYEDEIPVGSIVQVDSVEFDGDADLKTPDGKNAWFFYSHEFERWQPKVGERVRRINSDNSEDCRVGDTGVVVRVYEDGDVDVEMDGSGRRTYNMLSNLEPLPAAPQQAAWTPKVGDRVRWLGKFSSAMYTKGKEYVIGKKSLWSDGLLLSDDHSEEAHHNWTASGVAVNFELVKPLKIEAGKYYRTRDGRKVGPAEEADYDGDHYLEGGGFYKPDGLWIGEERRQDHHRHLISEWIDEPVAKPVVAATVDAIDEEYGPVKTAKPANDNASAPKFKVGDRVRFTDKCATYWWFGPHTANLTGEIVMSTAVTASYKYAVKVSNGEIGYITDVHAELELPTSAIVCLIEDGQPKPSDRPYVHSSQEAAEKEAKRLAGKHTGKKFGVYVLTGEPAFVEKTYEHEWQRQAAKGNKITAIRELRSITGLSLAGAKAGVERWLDQPEWARAA